MDCRAYIVNSFTERLAEGNPAGVVFCGEDIPDGVLRKIALDVGKSETAFVSERGNGEYGIRWFSPRKEMPLCGHATLAAAKVVFAETGANSVTFRYASGTLRVAGDPSGSISISFPLDGYDRIAADGIYTRFFPGAKIIDSIRGRTTKKVALILGEDSGLEAIRPDFSLMAASSGSFENGIAISRRSQLYDFESRYFNPWAGVDEDPITGSVHTVLAGYWGERLAKSKLIAAQLSQRPGILELDIAGDQVLISGKARIVFSGTISI